eukprot:2185342-Rhodomonas_salina.1
MRARATALVPAAPYSAYWRTGVQCASTPVPADTQPYWRTGGRDYSPTGVREYRTWRRARVGRYRGDFADVPDPSPAYDLVAAYAPSVPDSA